MTTPEQSTATPVERSINGAADGHDSDAQPTATRFAPIIAAAKEPPFTAYHAKRKRFQEPFKRPERFKRPASFESSLRS